jgi:hypothetical protein
MLPCIVIGIGGTGKWVITDLKRIFLEKEGKIPDNVSLLAFDLIGQESPPIKRSIFDLERGEKRDVTINFSDKETPEFYNFSEYWARAIFDIQEGRIQQRSDIYEWLKEDDAKAYNLSESELNSTGGAGQRRQTSRVSLFLHAPKIYSKIRDAVFQLGGSLKGNQMLQIFVVGSLAGGTGCGTFIDFANMIYKAIDDRGRASTPSIVYGIFLLPRGFEGISPSRGERALMESNCFAAFREMLRFMFVYDNVINYRGLDEVNTGGVRLFDVCYIIDGSQVAGESGSNLKPYEGICPAIADFIMLNVTEEMSPLNQVTNLTTQIGSQIGNAQDNPMEAQIYSTFGIYKYIFDVEEIKKSFAHELAIQIFNELLAPSPVGDPQIEGEAQNFLRDQQNTPFNNNLVVPILEQNRVISSTRDALFRYIKLPGERLNLPVLRLDDIQTSGIFTKIPFEQVEREANRRIEGVFGRREDVAVPTATRGTYYGVLNYYLQRHRERFAEFLRSRILEILRQDDKKGALDHVWRFLDLLIGDYNTFCDSIQENFDREDLPGKIATLNKKIEDYKQRNKQKDYLRERGKLEGRRQQQIVMEYTLRIAEEYRRLCEEFRDQIEIWKGTFEEARSHVSKSKEKLISVRNDKAGVKVHHYITKPGDQIEQKLYDLILGRAKPISPKEEELNRRLPHIDFDTLLGTFEWEFSNNRLRCLLPAEYTPLETLRTDSKLWNYNFINNLIERGHLQELNDITIMDILSLKGENPASLAQELSGNSSLLAQIDSTAQLSGTVGAGAAAVSAIWRSTFAPWAVSEPGLKFAEGLKNALADINFGAYSSDDPHQIVQYQAGHFIKMSGFFNLASTETTYREGVTKKQPAPLHNLLGEKNAAKYEELVPEILGERTRCLHPLIVRLLDKEQLLKNFIYAFVFGLIKFKSVGGKMQYTCELEVTGKKQEVPLGENLVEAAKRYLTSDNPIMEKVRGGSTDKIDTLINEKIKDRQSFVNELEEKIKEIEFEDGDQSAEADLKRLMKLILWVEKESHRK